MKILNVIYYIFFGLIALIVVLLLVSVLPITGNIKFLTVQSGSMEPTMKMGSVVVVKPAKDYKIGDIITFGQASKTKTPTTHRIVDIRVQESQPLYTTRGDANNGPDQKEVSKKEVIGKVLFDVPYIGYAVSVAKKPIGFLFIVIVPALAVIIEEVFRIKNELRKNKTNTA
ncbi:MAG: signal peptidase I [Candidatus Pacebacteria bacterium]|nr:signal peptidase I [Candidatus Paceibacterota bacterium]